MTARKAARPEPRIAARNVKVGSKPSRIGKRWVATSAPVTMTASTESRGFSTNNSLPLTWASSFPRTVTAFSIDGRLGWISRYQHRVCWFRHDWNTVRWWNIDGVCAICVTLDGTTELKKRGRKKENREDIADRGYICHGLCDRAIHWDSSGLLFPPK
jgi:hypothetical protein